MNLMRNSWAALMDMQPQRSHQIAWFVYGWMEREHILNVTACADWWMRAAGLSASQFQTPPKAIGNTVSQTEPKAWAHARAGSGSKWQGSSHQVESIS